VREFIDSHSLNHVELLGYQLPEIVEQLITRATACVCPSECYENCPLVLVNAVSLGTPVIAARTGGLPDFVPEGRAGWLFERGNHAALADRLRWVAAHRSEVHAMRAPLRTWGRNAFSEEANYQALMDVYRAVGTGA
jgi:glycosyltransferase involved in cell wall biosynthesis